MKIVCIDTGPHHGGKRFKFVAVDGEKTTPPCNTAQEAQAAWQAGNTTAIEPEEYR